MKLQIVGPRQGALWVRQGFRVFFQRPLAFSGLFATFLFAALIVLAVPFLGPLVLLAALPLVTLGFMIATRTTLQGRFPVPSVFVAPLRGNRARMAALIQLGLVYASASFIAMWLADVVDGGSFQHLQEAMSASGGDREQIEALLESGQLQAGMLLRALLAALMSIPFWHAPALVHWGGHGAMQSLFFSTVAVWRNKGAFLVYALTWAAVIALFSLLANLVFMILGQPGLAALVAMPAGLLFSAVFYASLYFTFADCFTADSLPTET